MKFLLTLSFCALVLYTAFANASDKHDIQPSLTMSANSSVADALSLKVFKSPTCGCCQKWIEKIYYLHIIRVINFFESPLD